MFLEFILTNIFQLKQVTKAGVQKCAECIDTLPEADKEIKVFGCFVLFCFVLFFVFLIFF